VFQSGVPCARHRQAQSNPSRLPVNRSKPHGSICVSAVEALRDCQRWMRRSTKAFHPQPRRGAPHCRAVCLTGGFYSEFAGMITTA
jgi:hypothetical protein